MPTLHLHRALLPAGWADHVRVTIVGPRIASVETCVPPAPTDERHTIGLPGLADLHSHAFQRGMAGLAERRGPATDSFWTWREEMYRFLRVLDPDDVEAIAALAYIEMLEGGFTRVGEFHYLHHAPDGRPYANIAAMAQSIASAADQTGISLTLLPCFYAHAGFGGQPPGAGQVRFINSLDQFSRLHEATERIAAGLEGATTGVAPHSLRAVTPDELTAVVQLAGDRPIHMHAAEQTKEVEDCIAWSGERPIAWLLAHHAVDSRWCLIHCTHTTEAETQRLARSGAVAGLCPVTEANLGDGLFDGDTHRDAQGRLGVGTDSNVQISAAAELRQLEYAQRLRLRLRNVMVPTGGNSVGRHLFDSAVAGGSQALGVREATGIAAGAWADIVSLDTMHPSLLARRGDALLDGWIFACATSPIECVWSRGRKLVTAGRHVRRTEIEAQYRGVMRRILE